MKDRNWILIVVAAMVIVAMLGPAIIFNEAVKTDSFNSSELLNDYQIVEGDPAYCVVYMTGPMSQFSMDKFVKTMAQLDKIGVKNVVFYIMSGGGEAYTALGIPDMMEMYQTKGFKFITFGTGLICSAAVPPFVTADLRIATKGTVFMVHEPSMSMMMPGAMDLKENLIRLYCRQLARHTKLSIDDWKKLLSEVDWFDVEVAHDRGMFDITTGERGQAVLNFHELFRLLRPIPQKATVSIETSRSWSKLEQTLPEGYVLDK